MNMNINTNTNTDKPTACRSRGDWSDDECTSTRTLRRRMHGHDTLAAGSRWIGEEEERCGGPSNFLRPGFFFRPGSASWWCTGQSRTSRRKPISGDTQSRARTHARTHRNHYGLGPPLVRYWEAQAAAELRGTRPRRRCEGAGRAGWSRPLLFLLFLFLWLVQSQVVTCTHARVRCQLVSLACVAVAVAVTGPAGPVGGTEEGTTNPRRAGRSAATITYCVCTRLAQGWETDMSWSRR